MLRSILSIMVISAGSLIILSCSKPGTPGISISRQPVLKDIGGSSEVEMLRGSTIEYLGEKSADSSMMKIRVDGKEGWVPTWSVVMKAKAAVVIGPPGGVVKKVNEGALFVELMPATLVAADTVVGEDTHIIFSQKEGEREEGWIRNEAVGYDVKDITFAGRLDKLSGVIGDSLVQYNRLLLDHSKAGTPLSSQVVIFKANLSELPDTVAPSIAEKFSIAVDKTSGSIALMKPRDNAAVSEYADSILFILGEGSDARLNWYNLYTSVLPPYVNAGVRIGYWNGVTDEKTWKALLLYRIDRSPENIRKLYETYKALIIPNIIGSGLDEDIDALIVVHDYIFSLRNYKALCAKISQQIAEHDKTATPSGAEVFDQRVFYEPIIHRAKYDEYSANATTKGDWLHSFWVRRIAEGNADEVYRILTDLMGEVNSRAAGMGNAYTPEGGENLGEQDESEPTTSICIFQDYSIGDCGHLLFDCGDFGDASTEKLDPAGIKLWNDLYFSDANGDRGNPKYIGKKFEITMGTTKGSICNEGQGGEGETQSILSFKMVN